MKTIVHNTIGFITNNLSLSSDLQSKFIASLIIICVLWLLRHLVYRISSRRVSDIHVKYRLKKTVRYTSVFIGILLVGRIWFEGIQSISTFLGLVSAGIAIALREPISNVAGWLFILWQAPFEVGDRVQLGSHAGDVIDLRLFQFTILEIGNWVEGDQSTGRIIHIPNGKIFLDSLANYSKGFHFIWNEIQIVLTFESNWKKAKQLLEDIVDKHAKHLSDEAEKAVKRAARKYMIFYNKLTPIVYVSVKDSGVELSMRYLCEPRQRRGTTDAIWQDVLETFAKETQIEFAYPTQRFYNRSEESKSK